MHGHGGQNWLEKAVCPWCRLNEVIQERDALRAENQKLAAKVSLPQRRKAMSNQTQDLIYENEELKALLTNAESELTEALAEQYRFREQLETLQSVFAKVTAERDGLKEALKKIQDIYCAGSAGGGNWNTPSRPRVDTQAQQLKLRWEVSMDRED